MVLKFLISNFAFCRFPSPIVQTIRLS